MATPVTRHPLGLPAGSVRAVLALMIAGQLWTLILIPAEKQIPVPMYLYFLTGMLLLFFFSHGKSIAAEADQPAPWGLPRGTIRGLIIVGTLGTLAGHYFLYRADPTARLKPLPGQLDEWPGLLIAFAAGLGLGWLSGRGPWRRSAVYQDLTAWVSLLAMLGLVIDMVFVLFINPSLRADARLNLDLWEAVLTGVVSFYFGART